MNFLWGGANEDEGRPPDSEIHAANSIIQELLATIESQQAELAALRASAKTTTELVGDLRTQTRERAGEIRRLLFVNRQHRERNSALVTTLQSALRLFEVSPSGPPAETAPAATLPTAGEGVEARGLGVPASSGASLTGALSVGTPSSAASSAAAAISAAGTHMDDETEQRAAAVLAAAEAEASLPMSPQTAAAAAAVARAQDFVSVIENGKAVSMQAELAAKLQKRRAGGEEAPTAVAAAVAAVPAVAAVVTVVSAPTSRQPLAGPERPSGVIRPGGGKPPSDDEDDEDDDEEETVEEEAGPLPRNGRAEEGSTDDGGVGEKSASQSETETESNDEA